MAEIVRLPYTHITVTTNPGYAVLRRNHPSQVVDLAETWLELKVAHIRNASLLLVKTVGERARSLSLLRGTSG